MTLLRSALQIAADHPAFAGHFPGRPVLPGAVLLDEALKVIEQARGIDLGRWHIASAKFLDAVRPRDQLIVEHDTAAGGTIRFTILDASRKVASGTLSNQQRNPAP